MMFQIAQNNLFGRGQKVQAAARLGGDATEFDLRFIEPWLFGTRFSLGVDAYKWDREYSDYSRDSKGGALSIGFPLRRYDKYTRGNVKYIYDDADISDVDNDASYEIRDMEGHSKTSSLTFSVRRDSRDCINFV